MIRYLQIFMVFLFTFFFLFYQSGVDHLKLGDRYLREGKISFAREEYNKALAAGANKPEIIAERLKKIDYMNREDIIHFNAAAEFDKNGDFESAIGEYKISLRINPESTETMKRLMTDLFKAGKNDEGIAVVSRLTEMGVECIETLYSKALYDYRKGNYEQAASWLKKCSMLEKANPAVIELTSQLNKKRSELALKKAMSAKETFISGVRHLKNRDFKIAAVEFYDSAANFLPPETGSIPIDTQYKKVPLIEEHTRTAVYFNLASAQEFLGNFEESVAALEKVNETLGERAFIYYKIGENYRKIDNEGEAYRSFLKVRQLDSSYPDISSKLGYCAKKLGRYEDAISHFRQAADYDPQNPYNYYNLAIMYKKMDRLTESYEIFQKALAATSTDSNLRYLIMEQINIINEKLKNQTAKK